MKKQVQAHPNKVRQAKGKAKARAKASKREGRRRRGDPTDNVIVAAAVHALRLIAEALNRKQVIVADGQEERDREANEQAPRAAAVVVAADPARERALQQHARINEILRGARAPAQAVAEVVPRRLYEFDQTPAPPRNAR